MGNWVKIEHEITDFSRVSMHKKHETYIKIHSNGLVVCPPKNGDWRGQLSWTGSGWLLTFDAPGITPSKVELWFYMDT